MEEDFKKNEEKFINPNISDFLFWVTLACLVVLLYDAIIKN